MNEFTIVTVIDRPVDEVFAVIRTWPRRRYGRLGCPNRIISDGALEPGSALLYQGTFLGRAYDRPRSAPR
jgi:hypothetical protein